MKITTDEQNARALKLVKKLMNSDPPVDSVKGKRLDKLVDAVMAYEKVRWPLGKSR